MASVSWFSPIVSIPVPSSWKSGSKVLSVRSSTMPARLIDITELSAIFSLLLSEAMMQPNVKSPMTVIVVKSRTMPVIVAKVNLKNSFIDLVIDYLAKIRENIVILLTFPFFSTFLLKAPYFLAHPTTLAVNTARATLCLVICNHFIKVEDHAVVLDHKARNADGTASLYGIISVNLSLEMSDEPFSCVVRYDVLAWMVT